MTKKYKRKAAFVIVSLLLLCAVTVFPNMKAIGKVSAAAIQTPKYNIAFNYEHTVMYGVHGGQPQFLRTSETNVYSAEVALNEFDNDNISFYIYGSSATSTVGKLESKGYINSSTITIEIVSEFYSFNNAVYSMKEEKGKDVSTGTIKTGTDKNITLTGLADGLYMFATTMTGGTWLINYNAVAQISMSCSFMFTIDCGKPIINGASESKTGIYTNKSFTVKAEDIGSGIKYLYMKSPNSGSYTKLSDSSYTVNANSTNGQYTFYAEDNAGNISSYYYVNFDDTKPTMTTTGAAFSSNTDNSFTVTATDNSGTAKLYYKVDSGTWKASGSKYTLPSNAADGIYYFYAEDNYGNRTAEKWIEYGTQLFGEFIKSDKDNSVYFTWKQPTWTATLDGSNYIKGTWIRKEGKHTIKLSSGVKSAVYNYTIDHYYVETYSDATCIESGFAKYECTQCGDIYTLSLTAEMGHYYVASTIAPTCTTKGSTTYTCTRCGDTYEDNVVPALGHNYIPTLISPTCTEGGYTLYCCTRCDSEYRSGSSPAKGHNFVASNVGATCTESGKTIYRCQVCGYENVESDGAYPSGHSYTREVIVEPTCTQEGLLRNTCDLCGNVNETKIAPSGHNYEITDVQSSDGNTVRTYTCSVCGETFTQELGDQYEEVSNYIEYLFMQYKPYMVWVLLATAGVWSIAIGVCIAIACKNEDKAKAKKMLINYVIGLVIIFVIIVACPYLVRGIASLIT